MIKRTLIEVFFWYMPWKMRPENSDSQEKRFLLSSVQQILSEFNRLNIAIIFSFLTWYRSPIKLRPNGINSIKWLPIRIRNNGVPVTVMNCIPLHTPICKVPRIIENMLMVYIPTTWRIIYLVYYETISLRRLHSNHVAENTEAGRPLMDNLVSTTDYYYTVLLKKDVS